MGDEDLVNSNGEKEKKGTGPAIVPTGPEVVTTGDGTQLGEGQEKSKTEYSQKSETSATTERSNVHMHLVPVYDSNGASGTPMYFQEVVFELFCFYILV